MARVPEKFVVRLLTADGALLAWTEVYALPSPQETGASCPFHAPTALEFVIEEAGMATQISVHWCDLDVARKQNLLEPVQVQPGQIMKLHMIEPVWIVPGMHDVPKPAVTVRRNIELCPDPASLGATGH